MDIETVKTGFRMGDPSLFRTDLLSKHFCVSSPLPMSTIPFCGPLMNNSEFFSEMVFEMSLTHTENPWKN